MLGELAAVAGCWPGLKIGDFNVEPSLTPCLLKGIRNGILVDLEEAWSRAAGKAPGVTCERCLGTAGSRRDFMVAGPLAAASLLSCEIEPDRWVRPHFAVRAALSSGRWGHSVCNQELYTHVWPECWLPAEEKRKSVELMVVWEACDDLLRCTSADNSRTLRDAIGSTEISAAWEVSSYAAESALIDAFRASVLFQPKGL